MKDEEETARRVLSVGQCGFDHSAISRLIQSRFGVPVVPVDSAGDAYRELRRGNVALVLVNRVLDADGSEGLEILKTIKGTSDWAGVPAMLITNYPECQAQAIAAGAEPGFGKRDLGSPEAIEKLSRHLGGN